MAKLLFEQEFVQALAPLIRGLGVIRDEELARFSDSTRKFVVAESLSSRALESGSSRPVASSATGQVTLPQRRQSI
jgi:hypothetical protein